MGSTSSKEHDPNPAELGTYASTGGSGGGQYPLRHHPQYSGSAHSSHQFQQDGGNGTSSSRGSVGDATMHTAGGSSSSTGGGYDPYYTQSKGTYTSQQQRMHDASADGKRDATSRHSHHQHSSSNGGTDAMDIDPPSTSTSDVAFVPTDSTTGSLESESDNSVAHTTKSDVVPMVFRWEHGGRNVYITGTFNGWSKQCPMHRSGNDFTYIANLTRGKHAYKFVVDDEWRFAPDQLTVADVEGNVNNFVDVSEFAPLSDFESNARATDEKSERAYGRFIPDIDEYTKEPPPLPPHLRHIILNKTPPTVDSRLLPVPQHVALNHLYCTAIKDGMMVLGITNRYKQKFVTTVYYSLMPGAN